MSWWGYLLLFLGSAIATWLSSFLVCWVLTRYHVVDVPNARSSHDRVVIRGGGIAILLVLAICWTLGAIGVPFFAPMNPWIIAAVVLMAFVSFTDDVVVLPIWARLPVHGIAAILGIVGIWGTVGSGTFHGLGGIILIAAVWVWLVVSSNIFNFMDGINGIATAQIFITALFGFLFCFFSNAPEKDSWMNFQIILAGAAVGFLPHNFPKARMFLGDVGSITLGFLLALTVVAVWQMAGWRTGIALAAMHLNFVMDATITMLRRFFSGQQIYKPHREHYYQRLHRSGFSHPAITMIEMTLQLGFGMLLLFTFQSSALGIALLLIVTGWFLFFRFCEKCFHKFNDTQESSDRRVPTK